MKKEQKITRVKVGTHYGASGYGRGVNKRNVWLIDGYCYAYHPEYAKQQCTPLEGRLICYIPVNFCVSFKTFSTLGIFEEHTKFIAK